MSPSWGTARHRFPQGGEFSIARNQTKKDGQKSTRSFCFPIRLTCRSWKERKCTNANVPQRYASCANYLAVIYCRLATLLFIAGRCLTRPAVSRVVQTGG